MDERYYLVDTNALLDDIDVIEKHNVVITSHVLRELEKHKSQKKDGALAYSARVAVRTILEKRRDNSAIMIDLKDYNWDINDTYDKDYVDNMLLKACVENDYGIITNDGLLILKAEMYNIPIIELETVNYDDGYTGVYDFYYDLEIPEHTRILLDIMDSEGRYKNHFNLVQNQYLVIWNTNEPEYNSEGEFTGYKLVDGFNGLYRWDGEKHVRVKFEYSLGDIKPINAKQRLMFHMLQNDKIKVKSAFGTFGVGKDFVMISHAVEMLSKGEIDKIIWVRNNIELKDSEPIGFLPGDKVEKLIEFAMPLADHVGGKESLMVMIESGQIEIQHLGTLRGRDIKNAIIYVTEVQNNTKEHIQLFLGRVGEGSQLWLNGDLKQSDRDSFKRNSGLVALKRLAGNPLYAQVTLDKIERSDTAKLAELLEN
jgi:PhoH-like ATPase